MADVLDSFNAREKYHHFRILVIGRANAGKTTLLKRVCNTTEDPRIYDEGKNMLEPTSARGIHDINRPFAFESNPQFIFHDSPGFEAGDGSQLKEVQAFIEKRAKSTEVNDQLHAIWFCFEPNLSRPLLDLEARFFNEQQTEKVPVIAIFTKFDDLKKQVWKKGLNMEGIRQVALGALETKFQVPLSNFKFPPKAYLHIEKMQKDDGNHQDQVKELIKKTADSLDNLALKILFVSVQQNNLELCMSYAVTYSSAFDSSIIMGDLVTRCLLWFRHSYCDRYKYGKTEREDYYGYIQDGYVVQDRYVDGDDVGAGGRLCTHSEEVRKFMATEFDKSSLMLFAAVVICLENSFWSLSNSVTFSDSFQKAFKLYTETGIRETLETSLKSLGDYPPQQSSAVAFRSLLLETLLKHRLPRSDNLNSNT